MFSRGPPPGSGGSEGEAPARAASPAAPELFARGSASLVRSATRPESPHAEAQTSAAIAAALTDDVLMRSSIDTGWKTSGSYLRDRRATSCSISARLGVGRLTCVVVARDDQGRPV